MLTTEKQMSVAEIKSKLSADLPLEKYGDIGDYQELSMTRDCYFDLEVVAPELFSLFLVVNNTLKEIFVKKGMNKIFLSPTNEKLVMIGSSSAKTFGTVEIKGEYFSQQPISGLNVSSIGDVNSDIANNKYLISTNKGVSVSSASTFFFNDSKYLGKISPDFKQVSGLSLMNLPMGKYSAELNIYKSDITNNDQLLLFDGLAQPLTIGNANDVETKKTINFDIPFGYIYLIAIDKVNSTGTTEFVISNLKKVGELDISKI